MKNCLYGLFVSLILLPASCLNAQINNQDLTRQSEKEFFVSSSLGYQLSGIKQEDFIRTNLAPSYTLTFGKWLTPELGLNISYKGPYFRTIADDVNHYYSFLFAEALLNWYEIFNKEAVSSDLCGIMTHFGYGLFYNDHYTGYQLNGNLGITAYRHLSEGLFLNFDISAVVGWDIYQGNEDILPGFVVGFTYLFEPC